MKRLKDNAELYEYLRLLSTKLEERGAKELAESVAHASRTSAGNMITEFLGESRIALVRVMKEERGVLTAQERGEMRDVLGQLDQVFERQKFSR
jgi:hypothetical protein